MKRQTWDEYFLSIVDTVAGRATCDRGRSGCVISRDNQILVTGYVGSVRGMKHCDEIGHLLKKTIHEDGHESTHCVRTVHAEQNALVQAAKRGVALEGATVYCTMIPCRVCSMLLINAGIKRIVAKGMYHAGQESIQLFDDADVVTEVLNPEITPYAKQ